MSFIRASGWVTIESIDTGSSGVSESLILNSGDSLNGDIGSTLVRTGISSSGSAGPVIVEVESGENGTSETMMMNTDVPSDSDW